MPPLSELPKRLRRLQSQVELDAAPRAIDQAAEEVAREAAANAPRVSGTLAESIGTQRRAAAVVVGPREGYVSPAGVAAEEYGEQVEQAEPFLEPAIENAGPAVEKALR